MDEQSELYAEQSTVECKEMMMLVDDLIIPVDLPVDLCRYNYFGEVDVNIGRCFRKLTPVFIGISEVGSRSYLVPYMISSRVQLAQS